MNELSPDLLTLLSWAERLAAGQACAEWDAWRAASPDAGWKCQRIAEAHKLLEGNCRADEDAAALSEEELAAFLEGRLAAPDSSRVEQACWNSPDRLAELLSAKRFAELPLAAATIGNSAAALESRLTALLPRRPQHTNGKPLKYRLAPLDAVATAATPETAAAAPPVVPSPEADRFPGAAHWHWLGLAAAILLAIVASGAVGWLAGTLHHSSKNSPPIAGGPAMEPAPQPDRGKPAPEQGPGPVPREEPIPPVPDEGIPKVVPARNDELPAVPIETPPARKEVDDAAPPRPTPPAAAPKHRPPLAPRPPGLAFRSAQGLMLVDAGLSGKWRAAPVRYELAQPTKVLSLAESWTTIESPGIGTLIWEGTSEALLGTLPDGAPEVQVRYGRVAIDNLRRGIEVRFVTSDASWTTRGDAENSTIAVVCDPQSSGVLVSRGAVTVDDVPIAAGQMIRWQGGVPQPAQPLRVAAPAPGNTVAGNSGVSSLATQAPPAIDPWDLAWLQPPDDNAKKQWRSLYGRVADRLAAADDAGSELAKLLDSTREPRQAALLSRWQVAATGPAGRGQQIWNMLTDRRAIVRAAGVECLLEPPPGDPRLADLRQMLEQKIGKSTNEHVSQWLATAWLPGGLPQAQAADLAQHLAHDELAVRQIAVSLLTLHTAPVAQQIGTLLPPYDAGATPSRRAAAQLEWGALLQQLFTPTRKTPAMLGPAAQPPQRGVQPNAPQGGT